jgi:hypothetical protein
MNIDNIKGINKYIPLSPSLPITRRAKEYLQTMPRAIWQNRMLNMTAYHNYYVLTMRCKFEYAMASKWWNVIHFYTFNLLEFMYEWRNAFLWPTQTLEDYLYYKGYYPNDHMYEFFKKDVDMKEVRRLDNIIENYNKKHSKPLRDYIDTDVLSTKYDILLPDKKLSRARLERELWKTILNSTYGTFSEGGNNDENK